MSDDLLKSAARALREETERPDHDGSLTRARLMASLHQTRVKKRTRLAFALPIAATFVAATALARLDQRLPQLVRSVAHSLGWSSAAPGGDGPADDRRVKGKPFARPATPKVSRPEPSAPAPAEPPGEPHAEAPLNPAPGLPTDLPESAANGAPAGQALPRDASPNRTAPRALSSARPEDGFARELTLYQAAHRAHFGDRDFARALQDWDAYLRATPNGRFAPEARYNRGICLLRLGREVEAQQALTPFAEGKYGDYRRSEAQAVIQALQHN